jgi:fatty acid desaturase
LFPFYKASIFFLITNVATGLYLLSIFAPNHKGMPQMKKGIDYSFIEQQIVTSRNLTSHWITDFFYLGLNYQIEHHLFIDCPRNKLSLISPYVRELCEQYDIPFVEMGVWESNRFIFAELKKAAVYAQYK